MEKNKINVVVKWYDGEKGFGIGENNNIPLFIHKSYFKDELKELNSNDIICCTPVKRNNTYHATEIEMVKLFNQQDNKYIVKKINEK